MIASCLEHRQPTFKMTNTINPFDQFGEGRREEICSSLNSKLDSSFVKTRQQSNFTLSYIEGWHAIAEANKIFGFDNWHMEFDWSKVVYEKHQKDMSRGKEVTRWHVSYIAQCRITVAGVVRVDVGSGNGIDPDCGKAHESAVKEAYTDAMKRALRTFGNPFGLALYDKLQSNVATDQVDLLVSDSSAFEKWMYGKVKSGVLTQLGLRAILKLAGGVSKPSEIKESYRTGFYEIISDTQKVAMINEGKNSKGAVIVEDIEEVPPLEDLKAKAKSLMGGTQKSRPKAEQENSATESE
jgi:DNA recombination protein Rad52